MTLTGDEEIVLDRIGQAAQAGYDPIPDEIAAELRWTRFRVCDALAGLEMKGLITRGTRKDVSA